MFAAVRRGFVSLEGLTRVTLDQVDLMLSYADAYDDAADRLAERNNKGK